mmetsp:Transcript_147331/g.473392  ORF Transcript_147331/g.473392 Transcript_147331/m.473392 type:complete len:299 (+) Transcript_147331:2425-3321(+)
MTEDDVVSQRHVLDPRRLAHVSDSASQLSGALSLLHLPKQGGNKRTLSGSNPADDRNIRATFQMQAIDFQRKGLGTALDRPRKGRIFHLYQRCLRGAGGLLVDNRLYQEVSEASAGDCAILARRKRRREQVERKPKGVEETQSHQRERPINEDTLRQLHGKDHGQSRRRQRHENAFSGHCLQEQRSAEPSYFLLTRLRCAVKDGVLPSAELHNADTRHDLHDEFHPLVGKVHRYFPSLATLPRQEKLSWPQKNDQGQARQSCRADGSSEQGANDNSHKRGEPHEVCEAASHVYLLCVD